MQQDVRMKTAVVKVIAAMLEQPELERYGLDLMRGTGLPSGTLYPILVRLERAGWLDPSWEDIDPVAEGRPAGCGRQGEAGMSLLRRFTQACVRVGAGRWPDDVRDTIVAEWLAELAHLRTEPDRPAWRRVRDQLGFALSVLWSPAVEPAGAPPRQWREHLPSFGRAAQQLIALAGVAAALTLGLGIVENIVGSMDIAPTVLRPGEAVNWTADVISIGELVAFTGLAVWLGRLIGRAMPLQWTQRTRIGRSGAGVVATIVFGATLWGVLVVAASDTVNLDTPPSSRTPAIGAWIVCASAVWIVMLRRSRRVLALGIAGSVVVLDVVAYVGAATSGAAPEPGTALQWLPLSLIDPMSGGMGWSGSMFLAETIGNLVRPMIVCSAFLLCYALTASRAVAVVPAPARIQTVRPWKQSTWHRALAGGSGMAGVALWILAAAHLTPKLTLRVDDTDEIHIWAQELREAAILLVVVALASYLAGRGPIVAPAVLAFAGLFATDSVVVSHGWHGVRIAWLMVATAAVIIVAAVWLSRRLSAAAPSLASTRRVLCAIAVFAVYVAPALSLQIGTFPRLPAGFRSSSVAVVALLWLAGMGAALAARSAPMPGRVRALMMVVPTAALAAVTVFGGSAAAAIFPSLSVLLVVGIVRGRRSPRPVRAAARWALLGLAALAAGLVAVFVEIELAMALGSSIMAASGFEYPADGFPYLPGVILVAAGVARLALPEVVAPHDLEVTGTVPVVG
jgi:DNA-binding PadR family transcriptional regulator